MRRFLLRHWFAILLFPAFTAAAGCIWVNSFLHLGPADPGPHVDDASRLNKTRVAEVWSMPADRLKAQDQLRDLLKRARAEKKKVSIAGARHTMGGHTISPDGIVVNMLPFNYLDLDAKASLLHVGAGARWVEVIPYLDARGFSVGVMQSNNDFSVGGSLSANCHGWQPGRPPIASTVESFRLMKADGTILRCSRDENAELFSLVLGGYGLFGIILDADLRVVPNQRYRADMEPLPVEKFVDRWAERVTANPDVGMAYGRLCIVPGDKTFLREATLTVFRNAPCAKNEMPALTTPTLPILRREVFRAQVGNVPGKVLRWRLETGLGEQFQGSFCSRNQLLNEQADVYAERGADRTDVIHEYFVPIHRITEFLDTARDVIPKHRGADLLNVTIRHVLEDKDAFLRYADQEMFAFVMLFNYPRTPGADAEMAALTRDLIDASLAAGGRYYLPYRLHATDEQFRKCYPQALAFFEHKRRYDPEGVFQNRFYLQYGLPKS